MVMTIIESMIVWLIHLFSRVFDLVTYIPFYFIQEPRTALELSNRLKAVSCTGQTAGPYKCLEEPDLTTTPDEECSTLDELFQKAATKYSNLDCLGWREVTITEEDQSALHGGDNPYTLGDYMWLTYSQVMEQVCLFGAGLQNLGVKPRDNILLLGETQASWLIAAQACFRNNLTLVTLHSTLGEEAIVTAVNSTEVSCAIISEQNVEVFTNSLRDMPNIKHIIYMKNNRFECHDMSDEILIPDTGRTIAVHSMKELMNQPQDSNSTDQQLELSSLPNDVAVIMYTSGSTDTPKGVLLTHINILAACSSILARTCLSNSDVYVAYLPQDHILELTAEISCLYAGCKIGFATTSTLLHSDRGHNYSGDCDLISLKPTVMASVPEILNRIHKSISEQVKLANFIWRILFRFSMAYKTSWLYRGANTPTINTFIMSSIRYQLGSQLRLVLCGGAMLNPRTQEFLKLCLNCPVIQGYGLTETAGVATIVDQDDLSSGHTGAPASCAYIKLVDWEEGGYSSSNKPPSGEIWIGGPSVALGYYKDLNRMMDSFHQRGYIRWFASGDIGRLRPDGTLVIVDRKNDVVKLPNGEFVSLSKVEAVMKMSLLVEQACAVNRLDRSYLVALVVPSPVHLNLLAQKMGVEGKWETLCHSKLLTEAVLEDIRIQSKLNDLYKHEVPQKITLIPDHWNTKNHFVTPSLKVRRSQILPYYQQTINKLFPSRQWQTTGPMINSSSNMI